MNDDRRPDPRPADPGTDPARRQAKGAARETIGKLIGDDAAIRRGRDEQRAAGAPPPAGKED